MFATKSYVYFKTSGVMMMLLWLALTLMLPSPAKASFVGYYAIDNFTLINTNADGAATVTGAGQLLLLLGGNNGSGEGGITDLIIMSPNAGMVSFAFEYLTFDDALFDRAGYLLNGAFQELAAQNGVTGSVSFSVSPNDIFGFRVETIDNTISPGELYISSFEAPLADPGTGIPEPGAGVLSVIGLSTFLLCGWSRRRQRSRVLLLLATAALLSVPENLHAGFIGHYALANFTLTNTNADGSAQVNVTNEVLFVRGGANLSDSPGITDLTITAPADGAVTFAFEYLSFDDPNVDWAGYLVRGAFTQLASQSGVTGSVSFAVSAGDVFGFRVGTNDNLFAPGELYVSNFTAPESVGAVPEPSTAVFVIGGMALLAVGKAAKSRACVLTALVVAAGCGPVVAQQLPQAYTGVKITGQLQLMRTINIRQAAELATLRPLGARTAAAFRIRDYRPAPRLLRPDNLARLGAVTPSSAPVSELLNVMNAPVGTGFRALSHYDQRQANQGQQFSLEPPNQSVAVGLGYVLVGVNNAIAVYGSGGNMLLPTVLSSNEFFRVDPAVNWDTGIYGPYPTDMRVFFDHAISRWFVLQRAQDYNSFGWALSTSRIYLAVSQTPDPLGNYSIYEMDTTNGPGSLNPVQGCPCFSDYPQIGADEHGFYISVNEFNSLARSFVTASILAISKAGLAMSATLPATHKFTIPRVSGYEFTIHPAMTPPGASYFRAAGGLQYFVSTNTFGSLENSLAVWAMTNTSSLNAAVPNPTLLRISVPTLAFVTPGFAWQKPGPIPFGNSMGFISPPVIDGGDTRVQSVAYSGGRLYVTVASQVQDDLGFRLVGSAYVVLAPALRGNILSALMVRQGYLAVRQNHLLRPAIAVNAQGKGAIAVTLVGPDYFPSAAFIPIDVFPNTGTLYIAAAGAAPQDGFTGYEGFPSRWGDYSTATVAADGSVWMITEYIPPGPRTEAANWGTYVRRHVP